MHFDVFPTSLKRLEQKKVIKPVVFVCWAPQAQQVSVLGDFNNWDGALNPMIRQPDGAWRIEVTLKHGHHHYLFEIDGQRNLDPRAQGVARDQNGERVSLIAVS
jgi:1,4-alpha-glucan branching enzyme